VCITGTLCVFLPELQRVEQTAAPEMEAISPAAVQRGVEKVLASETGKPATHHLYVHMPVDDLPRTTITTDHQAVHLNPDGTLANAELVGWTDWLAALHYTLDLPALVGITIVGALGVMLLALSVTGVVAHPRIFRDAFRLRARDEGGLALADWHNRLGVWTLPFAAAIALTGALIGLATVTAYSLAAAFEDGDVAAVYAPIFGGEEAPDESPAPVPNVAAALAHLRQTQPSVTPTYAILHDPMTAGQEVQISATHPRRLIYGETYRYDGEGMYLGNVGLSDGALGQQAAASTYRLHFGTYGGLLVKILYFALGAALTAVCATGVYIWLGKRARRGHREPRLRAAWTGIVAGTPAVLALTFAARKIVGNEAPYAAIFWIGLAACVAASIASVSRRRGDPAGDMAAA